MVSMILMTLLEKAEEDKMSLERKKEVRDVHASSAHPVVGRRIYTIDHRDIRAVHERLSDE